MLRYTDDLDIVARFEMELKKGLLALEISRERGGARKLGLVIKEMKIKNMQVKGEGS